MSNPTLSALVQHLREQSAGLRDQVKLKLHLASKDAQTTWQEDVLPELTKLEQELEGVQAEADKALHESEAGLQLHLALRDAEARWQAVEPHVRLLSAHALELGKETVEAIAAAVPERVKLQASLAKLEARDALAAQKAEARQLWDSSREQAAAQVRQALESLQARLTQARERPDADPAST